MLNKKKRNVMEQAYQVSKALQSISRADKVNMNDVTVSAESGCEAQTINTQFKTRPLILPLQQYLHLGVNSFTITSDVMTRVTFHSKMYVVRLSSSIDVFASKERPKKLIFRNENGEEFYFLCKQEKRGDLRKDLRVLEYVSIVNRILSQDEEGKEKHLQLNTFVGDVVIFMTWVVWSFV